MKKNIARLMVLGALILLCIWQTIMLWLGDLSSHNFFETMGQGTYEQYYVYPKQLWAFHKYAYNIGGTNGEENTRRTKLVMELTDELRRENIQISSDVKVNYADLLSKDGLVYEYGMPLGLNEISGREFKVDNKEINTKVKNIFVDLSASDNYKTYVYLIEESDKISYMLTLNNKLNAHIETLNYFAKESNDIVGKYYRASIFDNYDNEYFSSNVFYPLNNVEQPIEYEEITFNPLVIKGGESVLENMINCLFTNPLYKKTKVDENGDIVFSDNLNMSVRYEERGVLEFRKSTSESGDRLSPAQRMNKIYTFIETTEAIPEELKGGLYLRNIKKDQSTGEISYYFGYEYDNYDVILDKKIKEEMEIDDFVVLTIKNNEIIRGRWLMLIPSNFNNAMQNFDLEYNDFKNANVDESGGANGKFDNLECAYTFESLDNVLNSPLRFGWEIPKTDMESYEK